MRKVLLFSWVVLWLAGCAAPAAPHRLEIVPEGNAGWCYRLDGREYERRELEARLPDCDDAVVEIVASGEAPFEVVIPLLEFIPSARLLTPVPKLEEEK